MTVFKKHKWENFIQQWREIYPDLVREFYAHLVTKDSPFLMIRAGTSWTVSPKWSRLVKRHALKSQARSWNHFLKASLMPTSHNETVLEE
ncbi:hypothetical protein V6N12_069166 [Hibiscus sabdariffa]|uniref:Uncharacterized protein n=1 Tax=Hibiscus sabdariffa TaxID=183260 RepID=A0ABR2FD11_9ROSI